MRFILTNRVSRLTLVFLVAAVLSGAILSSTQNSSAATDYLQSPPATNTRRPSPPLTNTPRDTQVIPTDTPTDTPMDTFTPTDTLVPTDTLTPTPIPIGPLTYPDNINSLTGLPYPDDAARNRRNLIVKVSNYTPVVRPQSGLSAADIVYEYEVEGGVTRFAAIYRSQGADHVGSIRSGRLMDFELVSAYNALFAYSGSNDPIKTMILQGSCIKPDTGSRVPCTADPALIKAAPWRFQALTPQFGDNCPPFCRFPRPGLAFEHTLFGNTFQMWDLATKRNVNTGYRHAAWPSLMCPTRGARLRQDIAINWYQRPGRTLAVQPDGSQILSLEHRTAAYRRQYRAATDCR